jgi:hypothetical protein
MEIETADAVRSIITLLMFIGTIHLVSNIGTRTKSISFGLLWFFGILTSIGYVVSAQLF